MFGKKDWFFPDAELPPKGTNPELPGHESLIILNPNEADTKVKIKFYWTDRAPEIVAEVAVKAGTVQCLRVMEPDGLLGKKVAPGEQYAVSLHSEIPVVAQYGRLDMRTGSMAFYTTPGYCE